MPRVNIGVSIGTKRVTAAGELITGTARRRRWTAEEKAGLVAESL
jgi:transposase-like protein